MPPRPPFRSSFSFDGDDDSHFSNPPPYVFHAALPPPNAAPPPLPPVHRSNFGSQQNHGLGGTAADNSAFSNPRTHSFTTPGMDNLGESAAGGGITAIALGVANTNDRESGLWALRNAASNANPGSPPRPSPYGYNPSSDRGVDPTASYGSREPLATAAIPPGANYSDRSSPTDSRPSLNPSTSSDPYNPYPKPPTSAAFAAFDPNDIEDDGDDGFPPPNRKRKTLLGRKGAAAAGGAAGATALSNLGRANASGNYGPVPGNGGGEYSHGFENEKAERLAKPSNGKRRLRWIIIIGLLVIAAIVAAVAGGVLGSRVGGVPNDDSASAAADDGKGDLSKDSPEIKALLNNPDLHRVFPGMDYTPLNAQYPDCLSNPPSQNNITRDVAVLSQLTPAIRLYGTDCNQTEMVLHSIDRLGLTDQKVWLGVWLGSNDTTNTRQLAQMWDILDAHGDDPFAGVIVGNEVLYRKDLTTDELAKILGDVRTNLTSKSLDLPLATSDLGDNWTVDLATEVDIIMANIHPFFAGVEATNAASWTWTFWQDNDVVVTKSLKGKTHVISETGWPSAGGNDCGTAATCTSDTQGSVAGIDEMNTFMSDWVCQALKNGTEYFWFETFDEPWKVMFNTKTEKWEDKWGLMDVDRNLKSGIQIPDCSGQEAAAPSTRR